MAPTIAHALDISRSQLGYTEPATSQVTKYGDWYAGWSGQGGYRDTYWCAMYQSWVLSVAGFSVAESGRYGNCNPWIRWFKAQKRWSTVPRQGALVFYDWDGDGLAEHVGMVEQVRADGRITTLEGNATVPGRRDGVWRMNRSRKYVLGFGYLPYHADAVAAGGYSPPGASMRMPGPVKIGAGAGAPATLDARAMPWGKCPQMAVGFGGPEDRAQAMWAAYWYSLMAHWSPGYFRTIWGSGAGRTEIQRHEIGRVTLSVVTGMVRQVMGKKAPVFHGVIPPVAWAVYQPG